MSTWTLCGSTPARCPTSGPISSSCGTTRELLSGQDLRVGLSWQCQNPTWAVLWSPSPTKKKKKKNVATKSAEGLVAWQ